MRSESTTAALFSRNSVSAVKVSASRWCDSVSQGTHSAFVFIEAKIGTFDSAWKLPVEMLLQDLEGDSIDLNESCTSNRLNSSINGQLEMRWRFARSICRDNRGSDKVIRETRSITHSRVLSSDRFLLA